MEIGNFTPCREPRRLGSVAKWAWIFPCCLLGDLAAATESAGIEPEPPELIEPLHQARDAPYQRRAKELDELIRIDQADEWAGIYVTGTGTDSVSLTLVPQSGFLFDRSSCVGSSDMSMGRVRQVEERFVFETESKWDRPSSAFPEALQKVRWGERHYLIAPDRLGEFALAVSMAAEPRCSGIGDFLLKSGEETLAAAGLPELPQSAIGYIRPEPLKLYATDVELVENRATATIGAEERILGYRITLSAGARDGILPGQQLQESRYRMFTAQWHPMIIVEVSENSSVATYADGYNRSFYDYSPARAAPTQRPLGDHPNLFELQGPTVGTEYTTGSYVAGEAAMRCRAVGFAPARAMDK